MAAPQASRPTNGQGQGLDQGQDGIQTHHPLSSANTDGQPLKKVRSTSIFSGGGLFHPSSAPQTSSTQQDNVQKEEPTLSIKDQTSLELVWRKVANNLHSVDKVVANRMESIIPRLKSTSEIELEVANQNVEGFFRENKAIILEGFKQELGEGKLDIVFKQSENAGPQKILSSYEQLEEMGKINPSLNKLRETLELLLK